MYETDTTFVVEADLPGVHLENIDIGFEPIRPRRS